MAKKLERPKHLVQLESIDVDGVIFNVGENVWLHGYTKSPSSNNLLAQIIHNTRSGEIYVNVFREHRGRAGWHSFAPERLIKRNIKKKKGVK